MSETRPPRILVITFSYAPMLNARAFRWTSLGGYFAEKGWEVDVVTSWQGGAPAEEAAGGLRTFRVGWRWAEKLRGLLRRERGQVPSTPAGVRRGMSGKVLQQLRQHVWRHLYWPDVSCLWYWPARRKALELAKRHRYDAIVSVSPTFTSVLVGRAAVRALPDSRWLIDAGDPFSLQLEAPFNNTALYGWLNRRVEREAFRRADAVSVTTAPTAARYAEAFPESSAKLQVIPPLLSAPAVDAGAAFFAADGTLRFVYVGTLYRGLREPRFLLELFAALSARRPTGRTELHLFGDAHEFAAGLADWQRRLGAALCVHGMVPRETIARAVEGAGVLVNIGNSSSDQLPSKIVEYAASGKPILNIVRSLSDSSATFLDSYPDRLLLQDSGAAPSAQQLEALERYTAQLPRRLDARSVDEWLTPYRLPRIAARYQALLLSREPATCV